MLLTMICALAIIARTPDIDPALETRWRAEYPAAARRLQEDLGSFRLRGSIEIRFVVGDVRVTRDFTIAAAEDQRLMIFADQTYRSAKTQRTEPKPSTVRVRKPDSWFDLERPPGAEQFLLQNHARGKPERDLLFEGDFDRFALAATSMGWGATLAGDMNAPEFELTSIRPEIDRGREVVRIEYRIPRKNMITSEERISVYDVDLDPNRGWIKTRWGHFSMKGDEPPETFHSRDEDTVDYHEFAPGRFLPKRLVSHTALQDPNSFQHIVAEYREVEPGPPPEAIFTLQGYGLPDLPLEPVSAKPFFSFANPILWGCLAVALVATALLKLGRFHRSNRQTTT
ncbi:MAG: hypothetical protein SFX72_07875 [Isosphaeraceae bacterium]|nr:hypothetical protein [Isosphaeraceae bacterium]